MRNRVIAYLVAVALLDVVVPVPLLALLLLFVAWRRPTWFADLFRGVYGTS